MRRTALWVVCFCLWGLAGGLGPGGVLAGCRGESTGPAAGSEGGPCYGNGTCDLGLVCLSDLCVDGSGLPVCGDGVAFGSIPGSTGYETCDGSDLRGETCESLGEPPGELTCSWACEYDTSGCVVVVADCGNLLAEHGEDCDGDDFGGQDCTDFGFTAGVLACNQCVAETDGCCDADLATDVDHCGACHDPCPDTADTCLGGFCGCGQGPLCQVAGDVCCDGACLQTATAFDHCGGCGQPCDPDAANACVNGDCLCGGAAACDVAAGAVCCTTSCKYTDTDVTNCGGCGVSCALGETCVNGNCMCGAGPACPIGQGCCAGSCVDLSSAQYCGSCTNACDTNEGCFNGTCGCGAAGVVCEGQLPGTPGECCGATGCVVWEELFPMGVQNCGSCGTDCVFGQLCSGGLCL